MADAEIRPLLKDASNEDIIRGVNTALGILRGNTPGHFFLFGSDGVSRDIRGGAQIATGLYALKIQSESGDHFLIRDSTDTNDVLSVTDTAIKVRPTTFEFLLSGQRIIGDMGGADRTNRLAFLSNAGTETQVGAIPPSGQTTAGWNAFNANDPDSASVGAVMQATATAMEFRAESPSGSYAPIDWYTNATHQWRLDTAGALIAQGTGKRIMGDFSNATVANRLLFQNSVVNGASSVSVIPNGTAVISDFSVYNAANPAAASFGLFRMTSTDLRIVSSHSGASFLPMLFFTNGAEQMRIATTGPIVGTASNQVGFYGSAGVTKPAALTQTYSTADRTLSAYTADVENVAYTGIVTGVGGGVYAQVADLNALRTAYENLRAFCEDLAQFHNAHVDDHQSMGQV